MHGDFLPQCSIQFARIRFDVFLCVEDAIVLSADSGTPILGISDCGISPIVLLARSLARRVFLFRVSAVMSIGSRRNALSTPVFQHADKS